MSARTTVLVVDHDATSRDLLAEILAAHGHDVIDAADGESAIEQARNEFPHAVVLDLELPRMKGTEVLERLTSIDPVLPVLILARRGDMSSAVKAIELGAFASVTKPFDATEVGVLLRRALERRSLEKEIDDLKRQLGDGNDFARLMGPSRKVRRVIEQVRRVADSSFTVLLQGEAGSGKEFVARAIHRHSAQRDKPFIALDCGSIPQPLADSELFGHEHAADRPASSRFPPAGGATLFLDELSNLPLTLQTKLLRVLHERQLQTFGGAHPNPFDVRFVAATRTDLEREVALGRFRQDLYARLAEFRIVLPPLRGRLEDLTYLAGRFVEDAAIEARKPVRDIDPDALDLLRRYAWPGNVRELRNVLRLAIMECDALVLGAPHVRRALDRVAKQGVPVTLTQLEPAPVLTTRSLRDVASEAVQLAERNAIIAALRAANGNKSEAARRLKTNYKTLHVKIRQYGLREIAPSEN